MFNSNSRINFTDSTPAILTKMSDGNPGAVTALLEILKHAENIDPDSALGGFGPICTMDTNEIYGSDIWLLFSDLCDKSVVKTIAVLRSVQMGLLDGRLLIEALTGPRIEIRKRIDLDAVIADVKKELPDFNLGYQS